MKRLTPLHVWENAFWSPQLKSLEICRIISVGHNDNDMSETYAADGKALSCYRIPPYYNHTGYRKLVAITNLLSLVCSDQTHHQN